MACTNCGKRTKPPYTKCYDCFSSIKVAQPGDKCIVCKNLMMRKTGKFGEFMTCVAWASHPKLPADEKPKFLGQRGKKPSKVKKTKNRFSAYNERSFSWGSKPKPRDFRYESFKLSSIHESE